MASVASLEKIEIIRSQEFMPSEALLKFLKKMIILGPKTAILGPQFCRILVLGPHLWWLGGPPGSTPGCSTRFIRYQLNKNPVGGHVSEIKVLFGVCASTGANPGFPVGGGGAQTALGDHA